MFIFVATHFTLYPPCICSEAGDPGLCNSVRGVKITFCMKRLRSEDTGHWPLGFLNLDIDTVMFSQSFEEAPLGTLVIDTFFEGGDNLFKSVKAFPLRRRCK